ncbi:adenylate/guanylate cyclase domain-containing protein [Kaustia mangrovi]|uniref:Adenylate/guanylate cyclase domain-containing protein n=1 Tax=Kaustia mangrovi TaxID=2593653 RepID=A0A7S8C7Z7_9HYPH|nr:adenylate/guanylate cyclase domain-containing protein [Kaustia mangrovi]QPC45069.1 adenylate/guanylate cyclase domain-containing protein [Kaustia mangrovi]
MDLEQFNRLLLQSVGVGLAVADPETLRVLVANRRMRDWFDLADGDPPSLGEILPALDRDRLAARMAAGRPLTLETEAKIGRKRASLAVEITSHDRDGQPVLLVECQNVSKLRELEYMIQSYSQMVEKQNRELRKEKERVERVLLNIMPKTVYEEWRQFGVTTPRRYDSASILMLDFVGFTEMAVTEDPSALIAELNDIFTAFDRIVEQFGCERLKTIGDAYIAVSGIPEETADHAANIAGVALRIRHFLERRNESHQHRWRCRMGLATGPVVGSIVGVQKYVYDIFGPAMNLAARLEAIAEPMEIVMSETMQALLPPIYRSDELGLLEIKGFGRRRLFRLTGSDDLTARPAGRPASWSAARLAE